SYQALPLDKRWIARDLIKSALHFLRGCVSYFTLGRKFRIRYSTPPSFGFWVSLGQEQSLWTEAVASHGSLLVLPGGNLFGE
ncbi:MAG: hypothetical protein DME20_00395, partial [Verrucomicrobia bacterium]